MAAPRVRHVACHGGQELLTGEGPDLQRLMVVTVAVLGIRDQRAGVPDEMRAAVHDLKSASPGQSASFSPG